MGFKTRVVLGVVRGEMSAAEAARHLRVSETSIGKRASPATVERALRDHALLQPAGCASAASSRTRGATRPGSAARRNRVWQKSRAAGEQEQVEGRIPDQRGDGQQRGPGSDDAEPPDPLRRGVLSATTEVAPMKPANESSSACPPAS